MNHSNATQNAHPKQGRKPQLDNSVTSTRPVSPYRDAQFMRDLQAIPRAATPAIQPTSLVYSGGPLSPSLQSTILSIRQANEAKVSGASVKAYKRFASNYAPWWRGFYSANPARSYRDPAQWRDTSGILRLHYYHRALASGGPVIGFTLNLRHDIEALARSKANPCGWLQKRIADRLKEAFGRPISFFMVLEENERLRLHVHGELQLSEADAAKARKALRLAGGEWKDHRQFQAETCANPDEGWVGYISKNLWRYGPCLRPMLTGAGGFYGISVEGKMFSATADVKEKSAAAYSADRMKVWRYRYGRPVH